MFHELFSELTTNIELVLGACIKTQKRSGLTLDKRVIVMSVYVLALVWPTEYTTSIFPKKITLEEMSPHYYMHSDVCSSSNLQLTMLYSHLENVKHTCVIIDQYLARQNSFIRLRANSFPTGNTLLCGWRYELAESITMYVASRKYF